MFFYGVGKPDDLGIPKEYRNYYCDLFTMEIYKCLRNNKWVLVSNYMIKDNPNNVLSNTSDI